MSEQAILLRGLWIPRETIRKLELEHGGEVVRDDHFSAMLEKVLLEKKRENPGLAVKSMRTPAFPMVYFVPVELKIDPFDLGEEFRSGFHIFIKCNRGFYARSSIH
jgi:hypothetical protein